MQDEPEAQLRNAGICACWTLIINMEDGEKLGLEQIQAFVEGSGEIRFTAG
jgi:hypothetical protein